MRRLQNCRHQGMQSARCRQADKPLGLPLQLGQGLPLRVLRGLGWVRRRKPQAQNLQAPITKVEQKGFVSCFSSLKRNRFKWRVEGKEFALFSCLLTSPDYTTRMKSTIWAMDIQLHLTRPWMDPSAIIPRFSPRTSDIFHHP